MERDISATTEFQSSHGNYGGGHFGGPRYMNNNRNDKFSHYIRQGLQQGSLSQSDRDCEHDREQERDQERNADQGYQNQQQQPMVQGMNDPRYGNSRHSGRSPGPRPVYNNKNLYANQVGGGQGPAATTMAPPHQYDFSSHSPERRNSGPFENSRNNLSATGGSQDQVRGPGGGINRGQPQQAFAGGSARNGASSQDENRAPSSNRSSFHPEAVTNPNPADTLKEYQQHSSRMSYNGGGGAYSMGRGSSTAFFEEIYQNQHPDQRLTNRTGLADRLAGTKYSVTTIKTFSEMATQTTEDNVFQDSTWNDVRIAHLQQKGPSNGQGLMAKSHEGSNRPGSLPRLFNQGPTYQYPSGTPHHPQQYPQQYPRQYPPQHSQPQNIQALQQPQSLAPSTLEKPKEYRSNDFGHGASKPIKEPLWNSEPQAQPVTSIDPWSDETPLSTTPATTTDAETGGTKKQGDGWNETSTAKGAGTMVDWSKGVTEFPPEDKPIRMVVTERWDQTQTVASPRPEELEEFKEKVTEQPESEADQNEDPWLDDMTKSSKNTTGWGSKPRANDQSSASIFGDKQPEEEVLPWEVPTNSEELQSQQRRQSRSSNSSPSDASTDQGQNGSSAESFRLKQTSEERFNNSVARAQQGHSNPQGYSQGYNSHNNSNGHGSQGGNNNYSSGRGYSDRSNYQQNASGSRGSRYAGDQTSPGAENPHGYDNSHGNNVQFNQNNNASMQRGPSQGYSNWNNGYNSNYSNGGQHANNYQGNSNPGQLFSASNNNNNSSHRSNSNGGGGNNTVIYGGHQNHYHNGYKNPQRDHQGRLSLASNGSSTHFTSPVPNQGGRRPLNAADRESATAAWSAASQIATAKQNRSGQNNHYQQQQYSSTTCTRSASPAPGRPASFGRSLSSRGGVGGFSPSVHDGGPVSAGMSPGSMSRGNRSGVVNAASSKGGGGGHSPAGQDFDLEGDRDRPNVTAVVGLATSSDFMSFLQASKGFVPPSKGIEGQQQKQQQRERIVSEEVARGRSGGKVDVGEEGSERHGEGSLNEGGLFRDGSDSGDDDGRHDGHRSEEEGGEEGEDVGGSKVASGEDSRDRVSSADMKVQQQAKGFERWEFQAGHQVRGEREKSTGAKEVEGIVEGPEKDMAPEEQDMIDLSSSPPPPVSLNGAFRGLWGGSGLTTGSMTATSAWIATTTTPAIVAEAASIPLPKSPEPRSVSSTTIATTAVSTATMAITASEMEDHWMDFQALGQDTSDDHVGEAFQHQQEKQQPEASRLLMQPTKVDAMKEDFSVIEEDQEREVEGKGVPAVMAAEVVSSPSVAPHDLVPA